eukprot:9908283-Ditylum_brightwellii.AAC.2
MDGETLDPHMISGNISLLSSSAKQLLTKQGHPDQKSWKTWSKCLKLFANSDQLKVPLDNGLSQCQLCKEVNLYTLATMKTFFMSS